MARAESDDAEAVIDLILEVVRTFQRVQALGRASGSVNSWGGGVWGFLRTLALDGPRTVPDIARARPVARQRIQRLADEAEAAGLVEFIDNPRHRRSRLVRLTAQGAREYERLSRAVRAQSARAAASIDAARLRQAAETLAELRSAMAGRSPT